MKKYFQLAIRVCAHLVVLTALMSVILARDINQSNALSTKSPDPLPMSEWAKTIPISNNKITLDISVDKHNPVTATQLEGGMIRIEKPGEWIYGFMPYISDKASDAISVKVYQIGRIYNASEVVGESLKELHTLITGKASDAYLTSYSDYQANFAIKVVDLQKSSKPVTIPNPVQTYEPDQCCISCDGFMHCACRVVTDCGECCHRKCCISPNTNGQ